MEKEYLFPMSGLSIEKIDICDGRKEAIVQKLAAYDVVILSGGHMPIVTEYYNQWKEIRGGKCHVLWSK